MQVILYSLIGGLSGYTAVLMWLGGIIFWLPYLTVFFALCVALVPLSVLCIIDEVKRP